MKKDALLESIFSQSGKTRGPKNTDDEGCQDNELFRDYGETNDSSAKGENIGGVDESEKSDDSEVEFDPKNPGSSRYRNVDVKMAEPELYTHKDTGEECGGFELREGVITGLPLEPNDHFECTKSDGSREEISDWRLFLYDREGGCLCVLEYYRAIRALQHLAEYGEKFLIGEKDGYAVTTPLTRDELQAVLDAVTEAEIDEIDEGEESEGEEAETVYLNPADDPNAPYLTRLAARWKLFLPALILLPLYSAANYTSGLINMSSSEKLSLFLCSLALSAALFSGSYIVGYFLLSLVPRFFKKKAHTILKVLAIFCVIDILLRLVLILALRRASDTAANPCVFAFGTLFAIFDVWTKRRHMFRRILYASFVILLFACWHFLGIGKGSLVFAAAALLAFGGICLFNALADSEKARKIREKCAAFFKSWKVRLALIAAVASFAFFVWWLDFEAGVILWAVFVVAISIIVYGVHSLFEICGNIFGDKLAQDGISFSDSGDVVTNDEEEDYDDGTDDGEEQNRDSEKEAELYDPSEISFGNEGEQLPYIRRFGKAGTPCGIYSLTAGVAVVIRSMSLTVRSLMPLASV